MKEASIDKALRHITCGDGRTDHQILRNFFTRIEVMHQILKGRSQMLKAILISCALAISIPSHAVCAHESQLSYVQENGFEISPPLTVNQVENLTGPGVVNDRLGTVKLYTKDDKEWRALKAQWQKGDYFIQFKSGQALVERSKFYMDGLYHVRSGCIVGWLKGAIS